MELGTNITSKRQLDAVNYADMTFF